MSRCTRNLYYRKDDRAMRAIIFAIAQLSCTLYFYFPVTRQLSHSTILSYCVARRLNRSPSNFARAI